MDGEHTAGTLGQLGSISMVSVYLSEICFSLLDRICTAKFININFFVKVWLFLKERQRWKVKKKDSPRSSGSSTGVQS